MARVALRQLIVPFPNVGRRRGRPTTPLGDATRETICLIVSPFSWWWRWFVVFNRAEEHKLPSLTPLRFWLLFAKNVRARSLVGIFHFSLAYL